jgi:cell division septum initiation protein DivIVA
MTEFDRPGTTIDQPDKRRAPSSRLADLGDRLARTFGPVAAKPVGAPWEAHTEAHYPIPDGDDEPWEDTAPPFPVVRSGYDRTAVDEYLNELEREIDELRVQASSKTEVSTEIKKIGEQTAAILQVAHQQAHETTRQAQAEADKCLSDAASNAIAMTDEAKQKLRNLDSETDAVWHERARLIEDVRSVAAALVSLAQDAADRFPSEDDKRGSEPAAELDDDTSFADPEASGAETELGDGEPSVLDSRKSIVDGEDDVRSLDDRGHRGPFFES